MAEFTSLFGHGDKARIASSGEIGDVRAVSFHVDVNAPIYFLHYKDAAGRATSDWYAEDLLRHAE